MLTDQRMSLPVSIIYIVWMFFIRGHIYAKLYDKNL